MRSFPRCIDPPIAYYFSSMIELVDLFLTVRFHDRECRFVHHRDTLWALNMVRSRSM